MKQPIIIDTLEWYRQDYLQAQAQDDATRKELAQIFDLFARNQRLNPDRARRYLEQGLRLAESPDGHPYWELMFAYWHYTLTAPGVGDVDAVMRLYMKTIAPKYRDCPIIGRIYAAMIDAYVWADPISYAADIRQAIDYTFTEVPIEKNTYQRILLAKARMHYELQEPMSILNTATRLLQMSDDYAPDTINAYLLLAQANIALESYDKAFDNARLAHDVAQAEEAHDFQRAALTVQAAVLAHQRDWGSAEVVRFQMRVMV